MGHLQLRVLWWRAVEGLFEVSSGREQDRVLQQQRTTKSQACYSQCECCTSSFDVKYLSDSSTSCLFSQHGPLLPG